MRRGELIRNLVIKEEEDGDFGPQIDQLIALAKDDFTIAVVQYPQDAKVRLGLGWAYRRQKCFQLAENELVLAKALSPRDSTIKFELGLVLDERDDLRDAIRLYEDVSIAEPKNTTVRDLLKDALIKVHDLKRAAVVAKELVDLLPRAAYAHADFADVLRRQQQWQHAVNEYEIAFSLQDRYIPPIHVGYAETLVHVGNADRALEQCHIAEQSGDKSISHQLALLEDRIQTLKRNPNTELRRK